MTNDSFSSTTALALALALPIGLGIAGQPADPIDHSASRYRAVDLGSLGGLHTSPTDINDKGQIVGTSETASGSPHAFLWDGGTMTDLGTLAPSDIASNAVAINNRGEVLAASESLTRRRAFLWKNGIATDLGSLGGDVVFGQALNERGQVTGTSQTADGRFLPFIWEDGRMRQLEPLAADQQYDTYHINDRGHVAGVTYTSTSAMSPFLWRPGRLIDTGLEGVGSSGAAALNIHDQIAGTAFLTRDKPPRGFLWDRGVVTDLGVLPGGDTSYVSDLNDGGQLVGVSNTAQGDNHAVLWKRKTITDLGTLGGAWSSATALNDRGDVVGSSLAADDRPHAVLWRHGKIIDLGLPAGFNMGYGYGINNRGQAFGIIASDRTHGVLWTER